MDPELDFQSPSFNPLKALYSPKVVLPYPDVQPCDNIEQYLSIVRGTRTTKHITNTEPLPTPNKADDEQLKHVPPKKKKKSVLDYMNGTYGVNEPKDGPISLLQECYISQRLVQVWIRHSRGVRGCCHGNVLAFDRHMNVVLGNVTEFYTPLRTASNQGKLHKKRKKKKKKTNEENSNCAEIATAGTGESQTAANGGSGPYHQWECTRHVNQLFIRGDNVILIQKIQS